MKLRRFHAPDSGERKSCGGVFDVDRIHRASGPWPGSVIAVGAPEGASSLVPDNAVKASTGGIGWLRNPVTEGSA